MTIKSVNTALYERDFNLWIEQTIQRLKNCQFDAIDWENLLEEIESLSRSDKREVNRRLILILSHLLCLSFWLPEQERRECLRGWQLTIREQRKQVRELLQKSPSLHPYLASIFDECYQDAREDVLYKSSLYWDLLVLIPEKCPFTLENTLNFDYWPNEFYHP
jgi:hypothetical protein